MKQIPFLLIEDDEQRICTLDTWLTDWARLVKVTCGGRAKYVIDQASSRIPEHKRDKYAGILLDHDLTKKTITSADAEISGEAIAHYIIQSIPHPEDCPILIHSMNTLGSSRMTKLLQGAGFSVTRIPFENLTRLFFIKWLEEARNIWIENEDDI